MKFAGILQNPYVSKLHRHLLDGFKVRGLSQQIVDLKGLSLLDVCCGLGEYSTLSPAQYTGVDNSLESVSFASRKYKKCRFLQADAASIPFVDKSFDAVLLACCSHHFSDQDFALVLRECDRVAKRFVIVADIVKHLKQGRISRFLYSIDRGSHIRTTEEFHRNSQLGIQPRRFRSVVL